MTLDEATTFLRELLNEFPFADWVEASDNDGGIRQSRSMAVQIAAMLSVFCRGMVPENNLGKR